MSRFTQTRKTHVIIGGGACGLMLTNLLLHYGDNVILVERGDEHIDSGHADLDKAIDWGYAALRQKKSDEGSNRTTEVQRSLSDRHILYPQGYGLGGTSNINACIWSGGNPTVFNEYWPYFWNSVRMTDWLEVVRLAIEPVHVQAAKGSAKNILLRGIQFSRKFLLDDDDQTEFQNDCYKYEDVNEDELGDDDVEDEIHNSVWSHPSQATYLATLNSNETRYTSNRLKLGNLLRTHKGDGKLTLYTNTRAEFVVFQGKTAVAVAVSKAVKDGGTRVIKFIPSNTGSSTGTTPVVEEPVLHSAVPTSSAKSAGGDGMTNTYQFDFIKPSGGGEIILCAGVMETPRILIASGLKGTVNSHPASNCGRTNNVENSSQSKKSKDRNRRSNKSKFYNQRSSSSKYRSYNQKSPLPNLGGIGSQLQDHVVLPVLAIGNWCFTKEGDLLSALGLKDDGSSGSDILQNESDMLNFHNFSSSSLSEPINTHSIYENESMNFASTVYPTGNRSRSSSNVVQNMKLVDKRLQEISARGWIDNLVRVITFTLSCIKYMCFTLWWDIFSGVWIDKYLIPLQHMVKSISTQFTANGVHGWIDLDSKGNILDRDKYGSQMPYAQLMFIDGGCGAGYIPELLLPRMKYPLVYAHYLRPLLFRLLTFMCSLTIAKMFLRFFVFGFLVCLTNPQSKGRVYPNHEDPQGPLLMDLNLLSSRKDKKILHNALNTAHHLLDLSRQKDGLSYLELLPGVLFNYARPDDYFDLYASMFSTSFFHACGTCAMSTHLDRTENQQPLLEKAPGTTLDSMEEDAETITSDNTMSGNKDTQNLALSSPVSTTETVTTTGTNNSNIENDTPIHQNANTMDIAAEHPEMDREGNNVLSDTSTITFEKGATSSSQRGDEKAKSTKTSISTRSTKDYMTSILARDPTAVVDYKLRVLGVSGLRVADASVMPHIPSGPISATCMAMGAACAEFLHEIESNDSTTT